MTHTRLLGVTIDEKLNWTRHIFEVKKGFVNKLKMLKRSRFLPRHILSDLCLEVFLPSVTYALPVWGFNCRDNFNSLCFFNCRVARINYMAFTEIFLHMTYMYKLSLLKLIYKIFKDLAPISVSMSTILKYK